MNEIHDGIKALLASVDDPSREGLKDTPRRFEAFIKEFVSNEPFTPTVFDSEGYDEMIVQRDIPFYSICEHHLLPFFGTARIAYIPNKKIIGLSHIARTVEHFSKKLQTQERVTTEIADFLREQLSPKGVGVILTARHLCMEMRGEKPGIQTTTSCLYGLFKNNPPTRAEFLELN